MLQRAMELPDEVVRRYDLSTLRVIAASGSALPGELSSRVMDRFGDVLYNLYGSTEVAWATVATPQEMRAAPGTAGRPPRGTVVRLYDEDGVEVPAGATGRIFVGNEMAFDGYTGGGGKASLNGLLSSGDVGHFDAEGRLFVDGRDDEMIVSGGENVFPREVEDLLSDHPSIEEAAVVGVDDAEFGQRLKAHVVLRAGRGLDEAQVKAYVKEHLARYKVPREVVFLPELPRNATGKIVKRELLEPERGA
jgi:fatty-acyl-CoA synthase